MGIGSLLLRVEPKSLLFLFNLPARLHLHLHLGITFLLFTPCFRRVCISPL